MDDGNLGLSRRHLLAGTAAMMSTGCYGSFNLTGLVYDWNGSFSSKWVRWLVFLGLLIVPVYAVMLFVDGFILNVIEFFSGEHPVERSELKDGTAVTVEKTEDPRTVKVRHEEGGRTLAVFYCERVGEDELVLRDEGGTLLSRVRAAGDGVRAFGAHGEPLVHLAAGDCGRVIADARRTGSVAGALDAQLARVGAGATLAAYRRRAAL